MKLKNLVLISLLLFEACSRGGGGGVSGAGASPIVNKVTISPRSFALKINDTIQNNIIQFVATATDSSGLPITSGGFSWSVDGGSVNGTIDSTGLYTAPSVIPPQNLVNVRAASTLDATRNDAVSFYILTGPTLSFLPPSDVTSTFTLQKINQSLRMAVMNSNIYVTWVTTDQFNVTHLWYSQRENGVFSQRQDILSNLPPFPPGYVGNNPENPAIAVDSTGSVYVTWDDNPSGFYQIYAVKRQNGTTCGATFCFTPFASLGGFFYLQVDPTSNVNQNTPSVSVNPAGKIDFVWSQTVNSGVTLAYFKEFNLDGSVAKNSTAVANSVNNTKQTNPLLAFDLLGNISVAWMDYAAGMNPPNIFYSKMALNQTGFSSPPLQVETDSLTPNDTFSLAVDPLGLPYVAWSNSNTVNVTPGVYYSTPTNSQFQPPVSVWSNGLNPTIKIDYLKNLYLTWDDSANVYFRKINTAPTAPFDLSPPPSGINPVMDIDTAGRVYLLYSSTSSGILSTFYLKGE